MLIAYFLYGKCAFGDIFFLLVDISSFCRHGLVPHCHCHVSVTGLVSSVSTRGSEKAVAGSADWVLGTRRLLPAAGHDPGHEGGTLSSLRPSDNESSSAVTHVCCIHTSSSDSVHRRVSAQVMAAGWAALVAALARGKKDVAAGSPHPICQTQSGSELS